MADDIFKYVSGTRLMDRWGFDLVEMQQIPLKGYSYREQLYYGTVDYDEFFREEITGVINKEIVLSAIYPVSKDDLKNILYKLSDVEKFEKEHPETFNNHLPTNDALNVQIPGKISPSINVKGDAMSIDLDDNTLSDHLKIAIEAWAALYLSGEHNQWKTGHKPKIKEWIKRKYPELSDTAIDRIARVVNLNPNGGAPRSTSD